MKNIAINQSNEFDARTKEFLNSKLAQRLAKKYTEKSYEERYELIYHIANIVSFLCNGVSAITASSFVFAYIYSIVHSLPYPAILSLIFTGFILITVEILQRVLAPRFVQNWLQYNAKSLVLVLLVLSTFSICLSYMGSPDFINIITKEPIYEAPVLTDVATIKSDYREQINAAKSDAEDYRQTKAWKGRLSDDNAKVYKELLDKVALLRDQMIEKVNDMDATNQALVAESKDTYQAALLEYQSQTEVKGAGLGIVAILSQLIFYLCIWYLEYFDFRVASQYSIPIHSHKDEGRTTNNDFFNGNNHSDTSTLDTDMLDEIEAAEQKTLPASTHTIDDLYTIEHTSFKDGTKKRYNLQQLEGFISIYTKRLAEAQAAKDAIKIISRKESLQYWGGLKQEWADKIKKNEF